MQPKINNIKQLNKIIFSLIPIKDRQKLFDQLFEKLQDVLYFNVAFAGRIINNNYLIFSSKDINNNTINSYEKIYWRIDPVLSILRKNQTGTIRLSDCNCEDIKGTSFFKKFMQPQHYKHIISTALYEQGKMLGHFTLIRFDNSSNFNQEDIKQIQYLSPFLISFLSNIELDEQQKYCEGLIYDLFGFSNKIIIVLNNKLDIIYVNSYQKECHQEIVKKVTELCCNYKKNFLQSKELAEQKEITVFIEPELYKISTRVKFYLGDPLFICVLQNITSDHFIEKDSPMRQLTDRERQVTNLILYGYTNQEISEQLFISIETVKTHINNIFKKLSVKNRGQLIRSLSKSGGHYV